MVSSLKPPFAGSIADEDLESKLFGISLGVQDAHWAYSGTANVPLGLWSGAGNVEEAGTSGLAAAKFGASNDWLAWLLFPQGKHSWLDWDRPLLGRAILSGVGGSSSVVAHLTLKGYKNGEAMGDPTTGTDATATFSPITIVADAVTALARKNLNNATKDANGDWTSPLSADDYVVAALQATNIGGLGVGGLYALAIEIWGTTHMCSPSGIKQSTG